MARLRIAKVPVPTEEIEDKAITEPKVAEGAITTPKLANFAVVPIKVGAGVMTEKISASHVSASFTLAPSEVSVITRITGIGAASILFAGDGDGAFNMDVLVDGILEDRFPTNQSFVTIHSFSTEIVVRIHNPLATTETRTSSSFELRGVAR